MHYFTTDHLGSTRAVTDPDGNVLEQFDYLPYGQKCNNSSLAVANQHKTDYLYTGKELHDQLFDSVYCSVVNTSRCGLWVNKVL